MVGISVSGNVTASLLNLVHLGDSLDKTVPSEYSNKLEKVFGCVSDVRLWTVLRTQPDTDIAVSIVGYADSKIAQGMLAIFCKGLEGYNPSSILSLDSEYIAKRSGLQSIFPPGRLNGMQNILKLIQSQIRYQLNATYTSLEIENDVHENIVKSLDSQRYETQDLIENSMNDPRKDEIAVLLSGGVDSSLSLKLLLDQV